MDTVAFVLVAATSTTTSASITPQATPVFQTRSALSPFSSSKIHTLTLRPTLRRTFPHTPIMATQSSTSTSTPTPKPRTSVLFVCLGNICRSPAAEGVFQSIVDKNKLGSAIKVDSCGTGGGYSNWYVDGQAYHEGDEADGRMRLAASRRNINITSISRPLKPEDIVGFDYIVAMDESNVRAIRMAAEYWDKQGRGKSNPSLTEVLDKKLRLMMSFASDLSKHADPVPDPYYGGAKGFETVLDLLEDACIGLFNDALNSSK